jgi:hypothetical protein
MNRQMEPVVKVWAGERISAKPAMAMPVAVETALQAGSTVVGQTLMAVTARPEAAVRRTEEQLPEELRAWNPIPMRVHSAEEALPASNPTPR